ncbi:MAG: restriction endonuclease [Clostridia bacterium]|nr:restriction endonuclease [Clostridia bacterium]
MKLNVTTKRKLRAALIHVLDTEGPQDRAALIKKAATLSGLSQKEQKDRALGSKFNAMRAYAGTALDAMVSHGAVGTKDGRYTLLEEETVLIRRDLCEEHILRAVKEGPVTKQELFGRLDRYFGTEKTPSGKDDRSLYTTVTEILDRLTKGEAVRYADGRYTASVPGNATPMKDEAAFKALFLARLHSLGGEFFEHFTMALLEKHYRKCGYTVLRCEVSGGSADGGVDGLTDTVDSLGFRENIMVQTKCRRQIHVTETEIRAFYGAVCALGGSRGIFVTTSVFHPAAQKLLDSIENCVGIDGDKLFALALSTSHGIRRSGGGYRLDETAFS